MFYHHKKPNLSLILFALLMISCANDEYLVPNSSNEVTPLLIGSSIPDITLTDTNGETVNLNEISTQRTLFVFYRGGWCPFCSAELAELAIIEDDLYARGITVVGISPDKPEFLRESLNETESEYTLLSDSSMDAAKAFGIAFRVDQQTVLNLKKNGMDIAARAGKDHHLLPVPSVFLTNSEGVIQFQYVNPDYKTRVSHSVLLAAVDAMLNL